MPTKVAVIQASLREVRMLFQPKLLLLFFLLAVVSVEVGTYRALTQTAIEYSGTSPVISTPTSADSADVFKDLGSVNFEDFRKHWRERLRTVPAQQAYAELKSEYADYSLGTQHTIAHEFGNLLYEQVGIDGVTVCDRSFSFGCYHTFFARVLTDKGVQSIHELDQACIDVYGLRGLGCQHGIGHGLLVYLGEEKLNEALELCSQLQWKEPIGGCTSGVFMEYNFKTVENFGEGGHRAYQVDVPHEPCSELDEKFLEACYYEQTQWWGQVLSHDYEQIDDLCNDLTKKNVRRACYMGLGNTIGPASNYSVRESVSNCSLMIQAEDEWWCRTGAAWSFYAVPGKRSQATSICEGVPDPYYSECLQHEESLFSRN